MKFSWQTAIIGLCIGTVFLGSLVLGLGIFVDQHVADIDANPATHFPVLKDDSIGYVLLAQNLTSIHRFTSNGTTPETFRTPGYPIFVAIGYLFGGPVGVIFIQIVLFAGIVVFTFLIGDKLYGKTVALITAIIFAISPNALFHTVVILSDIPFTFLLIVVIYLLFFKSSSIKIAFIAGALLAIAAYIRPIGLYLPILFLPFILYRGQLENTVKKSLYIYATFTLTFVLLISPWYLRNHFEVSTWGFSSVSIYNIANYNIPQFLEDRYGATSPQYLAYEQQMNSYPVEYAHSFAAVPTLDLMIKNALKGNLAHYMLFHIESTSKFFLSSSVRYVVEQVEIPVFQNWFGLSAASPDLLSSLVHGNVYTIIQTLCTQAIFTIDRVLMILVSVFALLSFFIRKNRFYTLLFLALLAYFAILTGPVSVPRYRLPIEPYLYLLALSSVVSFWGYCKQITSIVRSV